VTDFHESKMVALVGITNGINRVFETPTHYVANSIRLFINGQSCERDDERKGWIETSDTAIETTRAPRDGDVLQAFYADKSTSGQLGLDDVRGSPYDPTGIMP
jgi:hypothetical protein